MKAIGLCVLLSLNGCASMFTAITDRAIVAEKLNKANDGHKVIAVTGDRRLVKFAKLTPDATVTLTGVSVTEAKDGKVAALSDSQFTTKSNVSPAIAANANWLVCAEPFAGALSGRAATSAITSAAKGNIQDAFNESLLAVDQRSSADRIYQDASHDLCLALAAGVIDNAVYFAQLRRIQERAFDAANASVAKAEQPSGTANGTTSGIQPTTITVKTEPPASSTTVTVTDAKPKTASPGTTDPTVKGGKPSTK